MTNLLSMTTCSGGAPLDRVQHIADEPTEGHLVPGAWGTQAAPGEGRATSPASSSSDEIWQVSSAGKLFSGKVIRLFHWGTDSK